MIIDLQLDHNENGLDFLTEMQIFFVPSIVVSGFLKPDLIEQALKNKVVAFLSKPFDKTVFTFHVKKLLSVLSSKEYFENHFTIKYRGKMIKIPQVEIMLITIEGNYSEIILESGKRYVIKLSLTRVLDKLNSKRFFQCYRSSVINIDKVESFNLLNNIVTLTNRKKLKVGLKYRAQIKKALQVF